MNSRVLVAPLSRQLFESFPRHAFVARTTDPVEADSLREHGCGDAILRTVWLVSRAPLSDVPLDESWTGVSLVLDVPALGVVRHTLQRHSLLAKLDLRVFLPGSSAQSCLHARLLASLGIRSGIRLAGSDGDWDALGDLLHYAVYTTAPHASIEPFQYLLDTYDPARHQDFGPALFDDPSRFLHLDAEGNVALTAAAAALGERVGAGPEAVENVEQHPLYAAWLDSTQEHLKAFDACSRCPGFRVCRGRYPDASGPCEQCRSFFTDLLEACEFAAGRRKAGQGALCR